MKHFTTVLILGLAACGCRPSMRAYEVGELEEERVQKAVKAIAAGFEKGDADLTVSTLVEGYRDPAFDAGRIERKEAPDGTVLETWRPASPEGQTVAMDRDGLRAYFAAYLAQWSVVSRALAKIRKIRFSDDMTTAEGLFFIDVYGVSAKGEAREDFLWVRTHLAKVGEAWKITRFILESLTCSFGKPRQFTDVSREVGAAWPHEPHPNARGYLPIPDQTADCGLACGDYDSDGDYDVYLCNGLLNRLLRNRGDGTFEDVTQAAGLGGETDETRGAVFADFDNDGRPDLYLANNRTACRLLKNQGDGTFRDVTAGSGVDYVGFCTSVTVADYDRDGLLDIYQGVYGNFYDEFPTPPVDNAEPSRLYRNLGGLRFEEVGEDAGVDDTGWTLAVVWCDENLDGWPDLLVANDFGYKHLYVNQKDGTFEDIAEDGGISDKNFGMSSCMGDLNGDGLQDLYFSNMYSNTNWIFDRPELLPVPWFLGWLRNHILGTLDDMTRGNSLFLNRGDGTWENISREAGVDYGQWSWGSEFLDYDCDGDLDIYCLNGFISGSDSEDL